MVNVAVEQLVECFEVAQKEQFTGCFLAHSQQGQKWSLFFFMGRLLWGAGGSHRFRRWFRLLAKHLPQIDSNKLPEPDMTTTHLWEYAVLSQILQQKKTYGAAVGRFIDEALVEILFEILQEAADFKHSDQGISQIKKLGGLMKVRSPMQALEMAQKKWRDWLDHGLISYSPNLAPMLKYPDNLKQKIPDTSYEKLAKLLTGSRSLREIASSLKVDPLTISQSLLPFINQGIITLQAIPDWRPSSDVAALTQMGINETRENLGQPLIFCIDDSPAICRTLEQVIKSGGYRFIGLQDSLQALPVLLENKPDLIFLDLVMPVASGYEICAQIRRVEAFKSTPVIILTGKDGMVDRVRAKLVGASDFLTKPIQPQKVLDIVNRYLEIEAEHSQITTHLDQASSQKDTEKTWNYGM